VALRAAACRVGLKRPSTKRMPPVRTCCGSESRGPALCQCPRSSPAIPIHRPRLAVRRTQRLQVRHYLDREGAKHPCAVAPSVLLWHGPLSTHEDRASPRFRASSRHPVSLSALEGFAVPNLRHPQLHFRPKPETRNSSKCHREERRGWVVPPTTGMSPGCVGLGRITMKECTQTPCRHVWQREVFCKDAGGEGKVDGNGFLSAFLPPDGDGKAMLLDQTNGITIPGKFCVSLTFAKDNPGSRPPPTARRKPQA